MRKLNVLASAVSGLLDAAADSLPGVAASSWMSMCVRELEISLYPLLVLFRR
jgi:hypothetical protein